MPRDHGRCGKGTNHANPIAPSLSATKSRVQRGRTQLREMLEACCEIAVDARGKVTDFTPRNSPPCCSPDPPVKGYGATRQGNSLCHPRSASAAHLFFLSA
jgi:hypothetical protein